MKIESPYGTVRSNRHLLEKVRSGKASLAQAIEREDGARKERQKKKKKETEDGLQDEVSPSIPENDLHDMGESSLNIVA